MRLSNPTIRLCPLLPRKKRSSISGLVPLLSLFVDLTAVEVIQSLLYRPTAAIAKAMRFLLLSLMHRAAMQDAQKAGAVSTDLEWAVLGKKGSPSYIQDGKGSAHDIRVFLNALTRHARDFLWPSEGYYYLSVTVSGHFADIKIISTTVTCQSENLLNGHSVYSNIGSRYWRVCHDIK